MTRDDDIAAIAEIGRRTRTPTPRWLWITAIFVGVMCTIGFAITMLAERTPTGPAIARASGGSPSGGSPSGGSPSGGSPSGGTGLGTGMVIGAAVGIVIGIAIGRQRSHSSRSNP